jgi:hypothetical protein
MEPNSGSIFAEKGPNSLSLVCDAAKSDSLLFFKPSSLQKASIVQTIPELGTKIIHDPLRSCGEGGRQCSARWIRF